MSDYHRAASLTQGNTTVEPKPDEQAQDHTSPAARTFAWAQAREPYDWMDAHTPCDGVSTWR